MKAKELAGIKRVFALLPVEQAEYLFTLWQEFEKAETVEAKFAKAIDRVTPLLHNLYGDGHSWRQYNISVEKIFSVNSRIALGSEKLWQVIEKKLTDSIASGLLK